LQWKIFFIGNHSINTTKNLIAVEVENYARLLLFNVEDMSRCNVHQALTLASILLLLLVFYLEKEATILGIILGLSLLTKSSGILLLPITLLLIFTIYLTHMKQKYFI
jgi:4-amino-4-deoxy-L-arabinose transferase-like glycosyltransferase